MSEKVRRYLDYAFLLIGIYLLLSLFLPFLIVWTKGIVDLGGAALSLLENLVWAVPTMAIAAALFLLTRYVFLKELALSTMQLVTNIIHTMVLIAVFPLLFLGLSLLAGSSLFPALFAQDSGLAMICLFLGIFYVISSVRDLNQMDKIEY